MEKLHVLKELETLLCESPEKNQFHLVVKVLYENEIVDEESIVNWFQNSTAEALKQLVRNI